MADYRIDVHRGLVTVTGTFSGKMRDNLFSLAPTAPEDCEDDNASTSETQHIFNFPWGGFLKCEGLINGVGTPPGPFVGNVDFGIRLTAETGFGDTDTSDIYITVTPAPSGLPIGSFGTDVTASFSGTIEVVFTLETLMTPTIGGMPTYGGAESIDSPPQTDVSIFERFVPDSVVSMEICADVSFAVSSSVSQPAFDAEQSGCASASDTITTHEPFPSSYELSESAQVLACSNDSVTAAMSVSGWFGATSRPTLTCTASAGGATGTATATGYSASVAISASGDCQIGSGAASNDVAPDRKWEVAGVVRRMEEAYTGAEVQIWDGAAYQDETADGFGEFSSSGTQRFYSGNVSISVGDASVPDSDTCSDTDSLNEWGSGIWTRLKASWLSGEDLEAALWPVLFRAFPPYDVCDLIQASERNVLTAYSGSGPSDISRTISLANGADTDLDGTDWSGFSLHGYAYMPIRLKKTGANKDVIVKIGSKQWNKDRDGNPLTVSTVFAEYIIDLLNPTNAIAATSSKDSEFPYTSTGPIVVADDDMWGVSNASAIVLSGLDSETYDVDYVKIERDINSSVTVLHAFNNWVRDVNDSDPNPVSYNVRLMSGNTDGCRSLDVIGFFKQVVASVTTYTHRTIEDVIDSINGVSGAQPADGWTATAEVFTLTGCTPSSPDVPDLSPCWLNDERYAAWIEGSGARYDPTLEWGYGFGLGCEIAHPVQAQMLFHRLISWPPALTDPLNLSTTSGVGAIFLPCATILKARAVGVVFEETPIRAASVDVFVDGGTYGYDFTAVDGTYATGTPYVPGGTSAEVSAEIGDDSSAVTIFFPTRTEKRACFRIVLIEEVPGVALEVDSPRAWLHISDAAIIQTFNSISGALERLSAEHAIDYWKRLRYDRRRGVLFCLGVSGSTWKVFQSEDGGISVTEVLSVTAETALIEVHSEESKITFYFENGAEVYRQESDTGDSGDWGSPEVVQYDNVGTLTDLSADLLDMTREQRDGGAVYLAATQAGDTKVFRSRDTGKTFEIVLA